MRGKVAVGADDARDRDAKELGLLPTIAFPWPAMAALRSALDRLASEFVASVLAAVRGASLEELGAGSEGGIRRGPGRPPKAAATNGEVKPARVARSSRRLPRRSAEEIAAALDQVVALVKKHKGGLRAEQIRSTLRMQAKEMPRVLKDELAKKKLKAKGQKRATTYTAV